MTEIQTAGSVPPDHDRSPGPSNTAAHGSGPGAATAVEDAPPPEAKAGQAADGAGATGGPGSGDRLIQQLALATTLLPFVVAAVWLVATVGGEYRSVSDLALTELHTRDVGRHPVLVGLYSRENWNHPGPALFYLLAPFYWLTGGLSLGISLGALAVNGAAVAGMGLLARRRGGTPLMLLTLLGCALLMRMLGADFLRDPWNCFVTTLPFGALVFLVWTLWAGEAWALPVAAAVATFLAQTHVGFVVLAAPLLAWGVVGLVTTTAIETDAEARSAAVRRVARSSVVAAVILAVGWLPPFLDVVRYAPSNARSIWAWFRAPEGDAHTLAEGWRVVSAQFGGAPEWLTSKRPFTVAGESPFIEAAPVPWLLALVAVAGVVLWRRRQPGARPLLATLALTFVLGVVAVARTVGPAFDYRLRWTYIPAMLGAVVVGWAAWTLVADRWPSPGRRALPAVVLAALVVVGGVNVVTAARAGVPQGDDSAAVASLTEQVLDELPDGDGIVLVTDAYHSGAWHARGLVLQLERRGVDVRVPVSLADEYGRHRTHDGFDGVGPVLVVTMNEHVERVAARPGMRLIAEWETVPAAERDALVAERDRLQMEMLGGEVDVDDATERIEEIADLLNGDGSVAWRVAVFLDESAVPPA